MTNSQKILTCVVQTAQTDQTGIRSLLDKTLEPAFRMILETQLRELESIEAEASAIASQRGWELQELEPAARLVSRCLIRLGLLGSSNESRIADILIRRNTRGLVNGLRNLHGYPKQDDRISRISQRLIDCETANIRALQGFL